MNFQTNPNQLKFQFPLVSPCINLNSFDLHTWCTMCWTHRDMENRQMNGKFGTKSLWHTYRRRMKSNSVDQTLRWIDELNESFPFERKRISFVDNLDGNLNGINVAHIFLCFRLNSLKPITTAHKMKEFKLIAM